MRKTKYICMYTLLKTTWTKNANVFKANKTIGMLASQLTTHNKIRNLGLPPKKRHRYYRQETAKHYKNSKKNIIFVKLLIEKCFLPTVINWHFICIRRLCVPQKVSSFSDIVFTTHFLAFPKTAVWAKDTPFSLLSIFFNNQTSQIFLRVWYHASDFTPKKWLKHCQRIFVNNS